MTTNTSPGATSKETSLTATTQPVFACSSLRDSSASGVPMILSALSPKIFQSSLTDSAASPLLAVKSRFSSICVIGGLLMSKATVRRVPGGYSGSLSR